MPTLDDRSLLHIVMMLTVLSMVLNAYTLSEVRQQPVSSGPPANSLVDCQATCHEQRAECEETCEEVSAQLAECAKPGSSVYTQIHCRDMVERCNPEECTRHHERCLQVCTFRERRR